MNPVALEHQTFLNILSRESSRLDCAQDYVEAHTWRNLAASRATGDEQKGSTEARDLEVLQRPLQAGGRQDRAAL